MSIIATQPEKKERELIPAKPHPAYLYRIVYLGTHKRVFEGKETQPSKVWLDFELPNLMEEYEDKETKEKKKFVRTIGAEYTLSLSDRGKLLPLIEGWLGRSLSGDELQSFDLCSLLGMSAFVAVTHSVAKNGKTYANISAVTSPMDGYKMPAPFNNPVEIGKAEWETPLFEELPKFLQDKINESNERKIAGVAKDLGGQVVADGAYRIKDIEEIPTINMD